MFNPSPSSQCPLNARSVSAATVPALRAAHTAPTQEAHLGRVLSHDWGFSLLPSTPRVSHPTEVLLCSQCLHVFFKWKNVNISQSRGWCLGSSHQPIAGLDCSLLPRQIRRRDASEVPGGSGRALVLWRVETMFLFPRQL